MVVQAFLKTGLKTDVDDCNDRRLELPACSPAQTETKPEPAAAHVPVPSAAVGAVKMKRTEMQEGNPDVRVLALPSK